MTTETEEGRSTIQVRSYGPGDESAWVRCRALAFLGTAYFDDVLTTKPTYEHAIELVAVHDSSLVGVIDVSFTGDAATIETIAVDPTQFRSGIGSALLREVIRRLPVEIRKLDAWTRDDEQANGWYLAQGFVESFRYLHVYASSDRELEAAIPGPAEHLTPVKGFFHARIENEASLRASFARVHVCRKFVLSLPMASQMEESGGLRE